MSNIHSLADYRRDGSAPYRAGTAPIGSPTPLMAGRSNFGTIGGLRGSTDNLGGTPAAGGFNEVGYSYEVRPSQQSDDTHTRAHTPALSTRCCWPLSPTLSLPLRVPSVPCRQPAREGISFFRSPDAIPGTSPTLGQQCCPRIGWRYLTTVIALVDLIVFIVELIVGGTKYGCAFAHSNQMGGPNGYCLYCMGAKSTGDIHHGAVWRLITPIFLHAGILHIAGNLWMLLRFGYILEARWGWWRFGLVYLLAGIGASMWSAVLGYDTWSVGASGAIMGIMGADITYVIYNYHEIPDVKIEAMFITITVVINFLFGISQTGIDNWAHFGGLMMGLPLGLWFVPQVEKRPIERIVRIVAAVWYCGLFLLFSLLLWVGTPGNGQAEDSSGQGICDFSKDVYSQFC